MGLILILVRAPLILVCYAITGAANRTSYATEWTWCARCLQPPRRHGPGLCGLLLGLRGRVSVPCPRTHQHCYPLPPLTYLLSPLLLRPHMPSLFIVSPSLMFVPSAALRAFMYVPRWFPYSFLDFPFLSSSACHVRYRSLGPAQYVPLHTRYRSPHQ